MKTKWIFLLLFINRCLSAQINKDSVAAITALNEDSMRVLVSRLRINSDESDFSPFVSGGKLYFVSGRKNKIGVVYTDEKNRNDITDLYSAKIPAGTPGNQRFGEAKTLPKPLNSPYYEGPFCLNRSATCIYFTANDKQNGRLKIYTSEKLKGKWSKPHLMTFCKNDFSYCHPTLSGDEKTMVFSSDEQGDNMDLYSSTLNGDGWSPARQLGNHINTRANEVFPFLSRNNILYFSSVREGGKGGMDIYRSGIDAKSSVEMLDAPLNGPYDDFGIWTDSSGSSGYFSSNRNQDSKDDLFFFFEKIPDFSKALPVPYKGSTCYSFYEDSITALNDSAHFSFEWDFGDGSKSRGLRVRHCYHSPGTYNVKLNVVENISGLVTLGKSSYTLEVPRWNRMVISCSDSCSRDTGLFLDSSDPLIREGQVQKVFWSFGDGKFNEGTFVKHMYRNQGEFTVEMCVQALNLKNNQVEYFKTSRKINVRQ